MENYLINAMLKTQSALDAIRQCLWDEYRKVGLPHGDSEDGLVMWIADIRRGPEKEQGVDWQALYDKGYLSAS